MKRCIFVTSNQNNPNHYMKYKLLCLFVLLSFSLSDLYADIELSSKQMRTSDGLPSNSVRCMFQDSKGFLWLGTLDGLTRYDGNTFLTYQLESGKHDRISLADNRIKPVSYTHLDVYKRQPPMLMKAIEYWQETRIIHLMSICCC